ncbi:nucleotidyltransferase domain-containing protein [Sporosarcina sp. FSL W8-0480]|uniref:type VII toxin-antitoxin system MntA family adenylyltransferase antitoxin n=1 Tax=Sporosarcina sp. FSL W8-0480 TaxID=2954701 RepID=UPI0030D89C63
MLTKEIKEQLIEKLKQEVNPAFIILFGSFAKDAVREDSDIDLAYFSNKQLSSYDRFLLSNELALIGGREVDLVDIKDIDTVFTMQIFAYGVPIYIQDENEFIRQRMRAYSMYVTLNEQRAGIINGIKERGSVFGDE